MRKIFLPFIVFGVLVSGSIGQDKDEIKTDLETKTPSIFYEIGNYRFYVSYPNDVNQGETDEFGNIQIFAKTKEDLLRLCNHEVCHNRFIPTNCVTQESCYNMEEQYCLDNEKTINYSECMKLIELVG